MRAALDHAMVDAPRRYDLVICGAGPAGSMTALLSARARPDLSILLLDALPEPRHRPCGEFLGPDGVRILSDAGIEDAVHADGARTLHGLSLHAGDRVLGADFLPGALRAPVRAHGFGLRREVFDRRLQDEAERAGATLLRATRATSLRLVDGRWRIDAGGRAFEATLVVGADGRNSVVRHRAGLDAPVGRKRFALVCRATGVAPGSRGLSRDLRHGEMHVSPLGQVGVAPLSDGAVNLNLLLSESGRALLKLRTPEHLMRAALAGTPSLHARTRGARLGTVLTTGSLPQGSRAVAADGVALVGDAAGFWDPFTGDGMCIALRGAELLARTVSALDFTKAIPENALEPYVRDWRRALALKRMISPMLHHVLARRRLGVALVSALSRSRWLGRLMVAIEGGRPF